jgi:hypothetical protein
MEKQIKNSKFLKNKNFKKRFNQKYFKFIINKKIYIRRKKYKAKLVFFFERYKFYFKRKASLFNLLLIFRVKQNNLFVTLVNLNTNKVWKIWSGGLYKLSVSKRHLKFVVNILLIHKFKYLQKKFRKVNFVIVVSGM